MVRFVISVFTKNPVFQMENNGQKVSAETLHGEVRNKISGEKNAPNMFEEASRR